MNRESLKGLTKAQLINIIEGFEETSSGMVDYDSRDYEDRKNELEDISCRGDAYMESHGRIDYGYGVGVYGPL
ncbi:hypothetical protein [Clostridium luticellarii]|uniref:Uncharacterized protein n=1 Tax=Clostridium luticellarii TaxID=1691940 RepID=A0A2T0BNS4_9CLOT|nr:hypothetical protein [Clostridium luticellarii]PRR85517.1 hypothetical protein CLLU_14380 [Clostridium luticellarii]